ncbi:hypothetical protein NIT7321_03772 [Phaeobacter italicus]|jgi:hypothetical protein|uniref:Uncharacterized protein n=1 Tax=Phaeobacter italicus TaxID=481446 RepID=A0A0H5D791_9RHOB|nr:hypothetical protein [Phaeobacter italicus]CRL12889.1 hypothetical protein NIT7321_03772 [Phaeobacter italicus]
MGSLRGRVTLTLAACAYASSAIAGASPCLEGDSRDQGGWVFLLDLSTKPAVVALYFLLAIALYSRQRAAYAAAGLLWGLLAVVITVDSHEQLFDDKRALGIIQDCVASPHLFIGLAIAICAGMTYGALRPRT